MTTEKKKKEEAVFELDIPKTKTWAHAKLL